MGFMLDVECVAAAVHVTSQHRRPTRQRIHTQITYRGIPKRLFSRGFLKPMSFIVKKRLLRMSHTSGRWVSKLLCNGASSQRSQPSQFLNASPTVVCWGSTLHCAVSNASPQLISRTRIVSYTGCCRGPKTALYPLTMTGNGRVSVTICSVSRRQDDPAGISKALRLDSNLGRTSGSFFSRIPGPLHASQDRLHRCRSCFSLLRERCNRSRRASCTCSTARCRAVQAKRVQPLLRREQLP